MRSPRRGLALADARSLSEALQILAEATGRATGAEIVIVRVADEARRSLVTCAVVTDSAAVAAELEGSRLPLEDVPALEESTPERLPDGARRAAERVHAGAAVLIPVHVDGRVQGSLELMRAETPFAEPELRLARIAAGQAGLVIRAFRAPGRGGRLGGGARSRRRGSRRRRRRGCERPSRSRDSRLTRPPPWRASSGVVARRPSSSSSPRSGPRALPEPLAAARAAADRALVGRHAVSVE